MKSRPNTYKDKCKEPYLKRVYSFQGVNSAPDSSEAVGCKLLNLGKNVALKAHIELTVLRIQVILKVEVANLIAILVFAVIVCFFLDGIISQVHQFVA